MKDQALSTSPSPMGLQVRLSFQRPGRYFEKKIGEPADNKKGAQPTERRTKYEIRQQTSKNCFLPRPSAWALGLVLVSGPAPRSAQNCSAFGTDGPPAPAPAALESGVSWDSCLPFPGQLWGWERSQMSDSAPFACFSLDIHVAMENCWRPTKFPLPTPKLYDVTMKAASPPAG